MPTNFYMWFVAALIPMAVGAVYYNEKVFGSAWMKANGFKSEDLEGANMAVIFGVSYLFSVLVAFFMTNVVIHQIGVFQMMVPGVTEAGSDIQKHYNELMVQYGDNFRTFGHGAFHGILTTIVFVLPLIGINALFERRGWKYIFIHVGYWAICLALMGGLLCATLEFAPAT